jgi:dihydropyrimidinase
LWDALSRGDLQLVSSDHAPYAFDETGKLKNGPNANFKQIASGLPGIEVRMPLLFDAMVSNGKLGLQSFVRLTSTEPAKIYNLYPRKGTLAVGSDADIAIWNPQEERTLTASRLHDRTGYTPYEGRRVRGWPETVMLRGRILVSGGKLDNDAPKGQFLPRQGGLAAKPAGKASAEFELARRFGGSLD